MRRTLQSIPLLLLISIILFLITTNAPGGALAPYLANPHITPADIVRLKHNLGLDQPVPIQYLKWLWHILSSGDLGWSTSNSEPVVQAILDRAVATLELTISAFVIALSLGLSPACSRRSNRTRSGTTSSPRSRSSVSRCRSSGSR